MSNIKAKKVKETKSNYNITAVFNPIIVPVALIITGVIGLIASFMLAVETIEFIKDPLANLSCNINPIVNCSSVIETPQGQLLGFMNPLIGIIGFSMLIMFGVGIYYKAKFPKFIWLGAQLASFLSVIFVHWLIYSSIYVLGALCPYCMTVWVVSIPILIYVTIHNVSVRNIPVSDKFTNFLLTNHFWILIIWYAIIAGLIIEHFGLDSLLSF